MEYRSIITSALGRKNYHLLDSMWCLDANICIAQQILYLEIFHAQILSDYLHLQSSHVLMSQRMGQEALKQRIHTQTHTMYLDILCVQAHPLSVSLHFKAPHYQVSIDYMMFLHRNCDYCSSHHYIYNTFIYFA